MAIFEEVLFVKKPYRILLFLVVCVALYGGLLCASAADTTPKSVYTVDEPYQYPILPGTAEWRALNTLEEKIRACHVDEELLASMTTPALLETVLTYPLLVNIYAFNSIESGMKNVSMYFPGISLLAAREDVNGCLIEYAQAAAQRREETSTISKLNMETLSRYLGVELSEIEDVNSNDTSSVAASTTYVYTPKGSRVQVLANLTWANMPCTYDEALEMEQVYLGMYSSMAKISGPNSTFNCHSYAWYSNEPSTNKYWIDSPYVPVYMSDGSYKKMSSAAVTYKAYWPDGDHSGIVGSASGVGGNPTIVSKWGCLGVYWHSLLDCPYYGGVTYWAP